MRVRQTLLIASLVALIAPTFSVQAAGSITYRWVDAEGNLQFSDTLPSGAASNGYQVIDPHTGTVVREVAPRKTAEEKAREAAERHAAEKAAREARAQAERDRILLSLYSSEADLRQTRDKRLERMDSRITQMEGSIERMQANINAGHGDRAYTQKLEQLKKAVRQAQADRKAVAERFEADLERLRQLRSNG